MTSNGDGDDGGDDNGDDVVVLMCGGLDDRVVDVVGFAVAIDDFFFLVDLIDDESESLSLPSLSLSVESITTVALETATIDPFVDWMMVDDDCCCGGFFVDLLSSSLDESNRSLSSSILLLPSVNPVVVVCIAFMVVGGVNNGER